MSKNGLFYSFVQITAFLLLVLILFTPFVIINAGQRGVLMQFGKVQPKVLGEGFHLIIPMVDTVQKLSVRVQKQEIYTEAASKDLQEIFTHVDLNWHIIPVQASQIFQEIGDEHSVIERIINPAVEEALKAVMAMYAAEGIINNRPEVKASIDKALTTRLANYHIAVDDISLVQVDFSEQFSQAVELKQIAEQEAKQLEFIALKASNQAQVAINLAKGEAEAQRIVDETLTTELLQKQAIEKWNGKLPLIIDEFTENLLDMSELANNINN